MEFFTSEKITCNASEIKVQVDDQNHGGIVELVVARNDMWNDENCEYDARTELFIEVDDSQIDALIEALQGAKKLAQSEYKVEYENHMVTRDYIIVESTYEGLTFELDANTVQEARHIKGRKLADGADTVRIMRHYDGNVVEIF